MIFYTTCSETVLYDIINASRSSSYGIRLLEDDIKRERVWAPSSPSGDRAPRTLHFWGTEKQQQASELSDNIRTEPHVTLVSSMKIMSLLSSRRNFHHLSQSWRNSRAQHWEWRKETGESKPSILSMVWRTFLHSGRI